jgi:hypothetical protein
MTTQENAINEVKRWKPALLAELQRQTAGKTPYQELSVDHDYHDKFSDPVYIIAIGEPPPISDNGEVGIDHRSLIIGLAIEEAEVVENPDRFVPHLVSSEITEFSEKSLASGNLNAITGKPLGRCGYPHHILYAPRANGIPSYKSVVKRAIKRSGVQTAPKKVTSVRTTAPVQVTGGRGCLISPIKGSDEVALHIGMVRVSREVADSITKLIDGVKEVNHDDT